MESLASQSCCMYNKLEGSTYDWALFGEKQCHFVYQYKDLSCMFPGIQYCIGGRGMGRERGRKGEGEERKRERDSGGDGEIGL